MFFFPACGTKVRASECHDSLTKTVNGKEQQQLAIRDFKAIKEKERATHFRPYRNSQDKTNFKRNLDESVDVNIGIMLYDRQKLKCKHGKSLLVTLKKSTQAVDYLMFHSTNPKHIPKT